jgi:hypothetical protein
MLSVTNQDKAKWNKLTAQVHGLFQVKLPNEDSPFLRLDKAYSASRLQSITSVKETFCEFLEWYQEDHFKKLNLQDVKSFIKVLVWALVTSSFFLPETVLAYVCAGCRSIRW